MPDPLCFELPVRAFSGSFASVGRNWIVAVTVAALAGSWLIVRAGGAMGRPRFVVALVLAGLLAGVIELASALAGASAERFVLGYAFTGGAARIVGSLNAAVCLISVWGLWRLRSWGRALAMGYLTYLIVSFLLWGISGGGRHDVVYIMLWQMVVLPCLTFWLMFLYRGGKDFGR